MQNQSHSELLPPLTSKKPKSENTSIGKNVEKLETLCSVGGNAPSYIYRLMSELYHPDDHVL